MGKVRILNTKTGAVKFVAEHIANDAKTLKMYGFIKQDLTEKKEEVKSISTIAVEEIIAGITADYASVGEVLAAEERVFEPETITEPKPEKGKPGRKAGTKQK